MSRAGFRSIPHSIEDDEIAIRAILSPYHVKRGKLLRGAFEAPPGSDEVSVSRRWYVAPWLSKAYAKHRVQRPRASPPKVYKGLAFVSVEIVRRFGSAVIDSRSEYLGHADIKHGIVRVKGVALAPDLRKVLEERLERLAQAARYTEDREPSRIQWRGGD